MATICRDQQVSCVAYTSRRQETSHFPTTDYAVLRTQVAAMQAMTSLRAAPSSSHAPVLGGSMRLRLEVSESISREHALTREMLWEGYDMGFATITSQRGQDLNDRFRRMAAASARATVPAEAEARKERLADLRDMAGILQEIQSRPAPRPAPRSISQRLVDEAIPIGVTMVASVCSNLLTHALSNLLRLR